MDTASYLELFQSVFEITSYFSIQYLAANFLCSYNYNSHQEAPTFVLKGQIRVTEAVITEMPEVSAVREKLKVVLGALWPFVLFNGAAVYF